jgi:hypothetical protein
VSCGCAIACDLGALTPAERARRAELAQQLVGAAVAVIEIEDGFALRLASDEPAAGDAFEWVQLERRCCPFLRFALRFEPAGGPIWVELGGSAEAKAFLADSGLAAR